jgi:hypothetical protein
MRVVYSLYMENARRYNGTTKLHEHKFSVSTICDVNILPPSNPRDLNQSGWVEYCGTAAWIGPCPSCGKRLRVVAQAVMGRYSESRKCDTRCTSATGYNCECQCGGRNHGAANAA